MIQIVIPEEIIAFHLRIESNTQTEVEKQESVRLINKRIGLTERMRY